MDGARNFGKGSEGEDLNANQCGKAGRTIAQPRRPCFEEAGGKQHDQPANDNQRAPSEFGVAVQSRADQKGHEQNGVAKHQHRGRIRFRRVRARAQRKHAGDRQECKGADRRKARKPEQ